MDLTTSDNTQIFLNANKDKFELSHNVVQQMQSYVQDKPTGKEAGGILLGRYVLGCGDVVVDKITVPMKGDQRSRFHFFRSAHLHQQAINETWISSGGTCNYLGEWHTHPESDPTPSFIDTLGWRKKLLIDRFDSDVLYFVIVGIKQINVWQGNRKTFTVEKLRKID